MKRKPYIFILVIIAANFALFLPAMKGGFFWDDKILVSGNPYLSSPGFLTSFLTAPFTGPSGLDENSAALDRRVPFYRPLTALSYWIDLKVWGLNPAGFHLTNILIQILNSGLFFFILVRLGLAPWPSFLGGLLFSAFPLHFESVGWISGRTDLLAFAWAAAAALGILAYRKRGRGRERWLAFSAVAFFLALLAKESAILLPGVFFLILFLPDRRWKPALRGLAAFAPALIVWAVLRSVAIGSPAFRLSIESGGRALSALGFYGFKIVFPFRLGLTADAGRVFGSAAFLVFGAVLAILIAGSWFALIKRSAPALRHEANGEIEGLEKRDGGSKAGVTGGAAKNSPKNKRKDEAAAIGAAFGFLILPGLLVNFSPAAESLLAWRFTYLASALWVMVLVRMVFRVIPRRALAGSFLAVLSVFYALELYPKSLLLGREEPDIWLSVKDPGREDALARLNIGLTWMERDEARGLAILRGVADDSKHRNAASLKRKVAEELAVFYTRKKDTVKAAPYYDGLLRSGIPQSSYFYLNYAVFLAISNRTSEGEKIVDEFLRLFPENHLVLLNAARFYATAGDYEKAAACLRKDYALFPSPQTLEEIKALDLLKK
jgi:tetratricopeptide (TPR) repeat protein